MIPPLPPEKRRVCTDIHVEPFCSLPVDADAFRGEIPALRYLEPYSPFAFCEEKKLYIHNMGHALCAYFGALKRYRAICEAIADPVIAFLVHGAMLSSANAIAQAYGEDAAAVTAYAEDLVRRFGNAALGDTVVRVGKDPLRKLSPKDRLLGALFALPIAENSCPADFNGNRRGTAFSRCRGSFFAGIAASPYRTGRRTVPAKRVGTFRGRRP